MSDDERLARVALGKLTEPGDARVAQLVAELGAVRLHDLLRSEHETDGLPTEVATRLAGLDPAGDLHRAATVGIRYVIPGDAEWRGSFGGWNGRVCQRRSRSLLPGGSSTL